MDVTGTLPSEDFRPEWSWPVHWALEEELAQAILENVKAGRIRVGTRSNEDVGYTLLMLACKHGSVGDIKWLVSAGEGVNACNAFGRSPLTWAVELGRRDVAHYLLECGADPACGSEKHYTPLMRAAYSGDMRLMRLLLDYGADVNGKSSEGTTAAHVAGHALQIESLRVLIKTGADLIPALEEARSQLAYIPSDFRFVDPLICIGAASGFPVLDLEAA